MSDAELRKIVDDSVRHARANLGLTINNHAAGEQNISMNVETIMAAVDEYIRTTDAVDALPPEGCICASFWTVRQTHKSACPLAKPVDGGLREQFDKIFEDLAFGHNFDYAAKVLWELFANHYKLQQPIGDGDIDTIVDNLLIDYTTYVNGQPIAWNVKKLEAKQAIAAHLQAAVREKDNEIVKLRADMAYAIGRFQGMEMDSAYLEQEYPEWKQWDLQQLKQTSETKPIGEK